jgi:hypothetical protein
MLGGAEQPVAEMAGEAEPLQRDAEPARRAGGGDRLGQRGKRVEEGFDAIHGFHLVEPVLKGRARPRLEVRRKRPANLRLDAFRGVGPMKAYIAFDRLLGGGGMAERRQSLGEDCVGQDLAVGDDAVEIEDQGLEPQRRSPSKAVPTRTWVAPVITAVS